jgi:glycosyltransferase involved in cell wall biosynthesis
MAHAVGRILDDPDLADRLSRNARRKAERFDWPPIIDEWRALLTAVANDDGMKCSRVASSFLPVP